MGATEEIMAGIPLHDLAAQLGVDEATAEAATRQAIPARWRPPLGPSDHP